MILIVQTEYSDGCSYSFTETVPIEYVSVEQFLFDLEKECNNVDYRGDVTLAGKVWDTYFYYTFKWTKFGKAHVFSPPDVMTLEEWLTSHGIVV